MGKGWLDAPLIKKSLLKEQKIDSGVQGQLKGPSGGQGVKTLVGVQGAKPRKLLCFSMQKTAFSTQTCIHNIVNIIAIHVHNTEVTIAFDESERNLWAFCPATSLRPGPPQNPNPFSGERGPMFVERFC